MIKSVFIGRFGADTDFTQALHGLECHAALNSVEVASSRQKANGKAADRAVLHGSFERFRLGVTGSEFAASK